MSKKLIGRIGVDSGKILIVDPCYLGDWKDNEFNYRTGIRNINTGVEICCWDVMEGIEEKINWGTALPEYNNKCMNELAEDTENWEKFDEYPDAGEFSYSGASGITCKQMFGELDNQTAVASSTRYGDGCYPVYVELDSEGRPLKITIEFSDDDDIEEDSFDLDRQW